MPKVSIVIPNYNYAKYLDERIQSLLNQTYKDFELIIVDDASTDNSVELIQKYIMDKRIRTIFYKKNSGLPYKRWNDGVQLAQGDYLLFAGADDSCHPLLLEKLLEKLENYPNCGLAYSQSWEIDNEGNKIRLLTYLTDNLDRSRWLRDYVNKGIKECRYLFLQNIIPNASAVLVRKNIFFAAGKFDISLRLLADWLLWIKVLLNSDIAFIAEPLNYFRTHPNTVRNNHIRNGVGVEEKYYVFKYIMDHLNVPSDISEHFCELQMISWINKILSRQCKIPWRRNVNIYRIAQGIDPHLNSRLLKQIAICLLTQIKRYINCTFVLPF